MPEGGLAFWLQFRDEALLDRIDRFSETAELRFAPSTSFAIPPSRGRGLRLGFASLDEDEADRARSEEHTSELQSLMRISYAVFCLKKKNIYYLHTIHALI